MATHSSILACRIPWTEEARGWATVHRVTKELDMNKALHILESRWQRAETEGRGQRAGERYLPPTLPSLYNLVGKVLGKTWRDGMSSDCDLEPRAHKWKLKEIIEIQKKESLCF